MIRDNIDCPYCHDIFDQYCNLFKGYKNCDKSDCEVLKILKENEQLKAQFDKLLDFVVGRTEECDICELTDTCVNSEGVCPFAWSDRNIKDLIIKHVNRS